jgi:hypothetical protein
MAYNFVRSTTSRLIIAGPPVTALPVTISAWIRRDAVATGTRIVMVINANNDEIRLQVNTNNFLQAYLLASSAVVATSSGSVSVNTWTHAAARFTISGSTVTANAYLSGNKSSNATQSSVIVEPMIAFQIASIGSVNNFGGDIADVGVWGTALSDAEIVSLSKGISCNRINPQSLRFYAPFIRNLRDIRNGRTITAVNSPTVSNHPRIYA